MTEGHAREFKSLRQVVGKTTDWDDVARACVCLANARGGVLVIGVEDDGADPPPDQRIPPDLAERTYARVSELTVNVVLDMPTVERAAGGGEYLTVRVLVSASVACTTDGRYFARVSDTCKPVSPENLQRLYEDKNSFVWETTRTSVLTRDADPAQVEQMLSGIRGSGRVKEVVRARPDSEILTGYNLVDGKHLTNLGVLWLGRREHRARLLHAPVVHFLRYDGNGNRVDKKRFGEDSELTPEGILNGVLEMDVWNEGIDIPNGLFRDHIPAYDREVVRELVANALVHRTYSSGGAIFLNLRTDRLEVHSPGRRPGRLPDSVTPANILHARFSRNVQLTRLFHDLELMEGEGTGYDRLYDILLSTGKPVPEVREGPDRVEVVVRGRDLDLDALRVVARASETFQQINDRERITLGLLAQHGPQTVADLARRLSLSGAEGVRDWLGRLVDQSLVLAGGLNRGRRYRANPALLRDAGYRSRTTLIDIEEHRLRELIRTDIGHYPHSSIGEILTRIGSEIPKSRVQRHLLALREAGVIVMTGSRRGSRYEPAQNKPAS